MQESHLQLKYVQILIDSSADQSIDKSHRNRYQLETAYGVLKHHYGALHLEKAPNDVLSAIADNPAVITLRAAAGAHPATQQGHLELTATAELPATLSAVAVLRLVALVQFTAILEGLVMESAATNQAEWMRIEVRERL